MMRHPATLSGILIIALSGNVNADVFVGKWKLFVGSNGTEIGDAEPTFKLNISQKGTFYEVQVKLPVLPKTPREGNFNERGGWGGFLQGEEENRTQIGLSRIREKFSGKYMLSEDERSIEHLDGSVAFKYKKAGPMICTKDLGCFKPMADTGPAGPGALAAEENYSEVFRPAPKKIRSGFSVSVSGPGDSPKEDEKMLSLESFYVVQGKSKYDAVQEAISSFVRTQKAERWDDFRTDLYRYQQVELSWKEPHGTSIVNYRVSLTTKDDSVHIAVDINCTPQCRYSPDKAIMYMGQIFDAAMNAGTSPAPSQGAPKEGLDSGSSIVGIWRGTVKQRGESAYDVIFNFTTPNKARVEYPSLECEGSLSGGVTGPNSFKYRETISSGRCANSTDVIRLIDDNAMRVLWSVGLKTVSATLKRDAVEE